MKFIAGIILSMLVLYTKQGCKPKLPAHCLKGELAIKGICMNYTVKLLEGNLDTTLIASQWKDDHADKMYTNVFALSNPCSFPAGIKEGDIFYFTIDNNKQEDCAVCKAYYPVPPKRLSIKIVERCN